MNSGTEDTSVDPITRLEHYRQESRYPPDSRPARNMAFDLDQIPLIDGDASQGAEISDFTGDALENGSLAINFNVKVREPGRYSFKTIVANSNKESVALCSITRDLPAGIHTLSFQLYGLIVRESNDSGPFQLPGITGERVPNDQELQSFAEGKLKRPPQGALKRMSKAYKTKKYTIAAFSEREWDSVEKRNRIQELEAEIKQSKH